MSAKQAQDLAIIREAEWRKCQASFWYFFCTYWFVIGGFGKQKVDPREAQRIAAEIFQQERRTITVKARQIGWTTLICAFVCWTALFKENARILVLSRREDPEARTIISMVKFGYDNLPLWMQRRVRLINNNMTKLTFSNSSYIDSDASKDNPARGRTLDLLVMDEFGKFPNPKDAWGSALPATEFGKCIVLGNANGWNTFYHIQYLKAKSGESDFVPLFFGWREGGQHRTDEWFARETSSMLPSQVAAEYPENDVECWVQAGSPRFDNAFLTSLPTRDPVIYELQGDKLRQDPAGVIDVYFLPEDGRKYVIGVDTAAGGPEGDFTCAQVLTTSGQHVAEYHARVEPSVAAWDVMRLARAYNNAYIVPERNNTGVAFIEALLAHRYFNLYQEQRYGQRGVNRGMRYGFQTTAETKQLALDKMWNSLKEGTLQTVSAKYIKEMVEYHVTESGETEGADHDDRVMGMAMAAVGLDQVLVRRVTPTPAQPPDPDDLSEYVTPEGAIMPMTFREYVEQSPGSTRTRTFTLRSPRRRR